MKFVAQRVGRATLSVSDTPVSEIGYGLVVFLGVKEGDTEKEAQKCMEKLAGLRVFEDDGGKMNLSVRDVGGEILLVSQFTLYGDCSHGRRPYFGNAMEPVGANAMYEKFVEYVRSHGVHVETGEFGADMKVTLTNDGPVTIILESENKGRKQK